MFGPTHLTDIWRQWCPTDGQLAWVFDPGDSNQVNGNLVFYYFGFNSSDIEELMVKKMSSGLGSSVSAAKYTILLWRSVPSLLMAFLF
jgi:hypothetical protein